MPRSPELIKSSYLPLIAMFQLENEIFENEFMFMACLTAQVLNELSQRPERVMFQLVIIQSRKCIHWPLLDDTQGAFGGGAFKVRSEI